MATIPRCVALIVAWTLFVLHTDGQEFKGRVEVHATEITADVRDSNGRVPRDLQPADFVVLENGISQKVIGVAYADAPSSPDTEVAPNRRVVIFVQESLSTTNGVRLALRSLAEEAGSVVAAGDAEVVTDYPRPHSLFGPTHDAAALRAFLGKLSGEITGQEELVRIRNAFAATDLPADDEPAAAAIAARKDQMRVRARKESTALRKREDVLLQWLSQYQKRTDGPLRTLLLVSDGFDLDPTSFFRLRELRSLSAAPHHEELARALAAEHWTIVSLAMVPPPQALTPPAEFQSAIPDSLEAGFGKAEKLRSTPVNRYPLAPLHRFADATGGTVITEVKDVGTQLRDLSQRVVITYQSDHPPDSALRPIQITSKRPNLTIRAQRWAGTAGSHTFAEVIAASFATEVATTKEEAARGDLPVTCSITFGPVVKGVRNSELKARVDLSPIGDLVAPDEEGELDFTVAVVSANEQPFTITRRMENVDLAAANGYTCTIGIRHQKNARIAVVASEPSTGSWGTCTVNAGAHGGEATGRVR